jgi:hypothetical protein
MFKLVLIIGLLFPFTFGAYNESPENIVIARYNEARQDYVLNRWGNDQYLDSRFLMKKLSDEFYSCDIIKLFQSLDQNRDRQMAHFFIAKSLTLYRGIEESEIWRESLDPTINSAISFFKRSRTLMYGISKRDLESAKDILPSLLSIQEKYLHHLREDEEKMELASRWIKEFEYIATNFDVPNLDDLLTEYRYLRSMAKIYKGAIPKDGPDRFPILRSYYSLRIRCNNLFRRCWRTLDDFKFARLPRKLLFLIITGHYRHITFEFLGNDKDYSDIVFNRELYDIGETFKNKLKEGIILPHKSMMKNLIFVEYLQNCIKPGGNINNLSERDLWLIKVVLYILSILK